MPADPMERGIFYLEDAKARSGPWTASQVLKIWKQARVGAGAVCLPAMGDRRGAIGIRVVVQMARARFWRIVLFASIAVNIVGFFLLLLSPGR